ncbi:MAG: hypothetical protein QXY05_02960 [Candidatus Anstonellales archaeon]
MNNGEMPHESILRIARIVEDVAKIHELYEEIDRLNIPSEVKTELNKMIESMELLSMLKTANITGNAPRDYESEYTKIKRGVAYVKIDGGWKRIGIVTSYDTIQELIKLREKVVLDLVSIFSTLNIEALDENASSSEEKKEIFEMHEKMQMDIRTLAILLRNVSERLLFNEQEQGAGLKLVYKTLKSKIENEYQNNPEEFDDEVDDQIRKANENYIKYETTKSNRMFEEMLQKDMLGTWGDVYANMPDYFTDENGVLKRKIESGLALESITIKDGEGLLKEAFATLSKIFGTEDSEKSVAEFDTLEQEEKVKKEMVMKKLEENKKRMEDLFYTYLQKREEQKAEKQLKKIEKMDKTRVLKGLNGAVEDMSVMRRLMKQVERMRLTDETKMRYASIAQSLELLHIIKTGIITQEHRRDFWEIRNGIVYLKNPHKKFWNVDEQEIKLGNIDEERELIAKEISIQREWAFKEMKKSLQKDVESLDSKELGELLENIGRRLIFNQQDQHEGLIALLEIVWEKLEKKFKKEKELKNETDESGIDEFAIRSDEIAKKIITTIRYLEDMETSNDVAKASAFKLTERMYDLYLEAKRQNIVRFRKERENYVETVVDISDGISILVEDLIMKKDPIFKRLSDEQIDKLFEVDAIDHDKVLLKGARDKAYPLIAHMRQIIRMIEEDEYKNYMRDLEILFEAAAALISKFVIRFQVPYVLDENEKGGVERKLKYAESIFMIGMLINFLDVLKKWGKIRVPYYDYETETRIAMKRIVEEALCDSVQTIKDAYTVITTIDHLVGDNKELMKEVADMVRHVGNRVIEIETEEEKKKTQRTEDDLLMLGGVMEVVSKYTENEFYLIYASNKYHDQLFKIIDSLKTPSHDINFLLYTIQRMIGNKVSEEKMKTSEIKEFYFGSLFRKLNEVREAVKNIWKPEDIRTLDQIIVTVALHLGSGKKDVEIRLGSRRKGTISFFTEESRGIGKIRRMV